MSDAQLSFRKSANIDRVTDKRKDSLFRLVDTDGSGTIDAQEFAVLYDAIKKDLAEELEKEAALQKEASSARRRFKMLLLFVAVLVSFLAASVAANFAVIFTVVDQAITTTTTSSGLLEVKGTGAIAKTAVATEDVPLIAAPALDLSTLAQVKSLKVSYGPLVKRVEAQLSVVAVRKHNSTFVEFVTDVPGETVEMLNGIASLVVYPAWAGAKPKKTRICSSNATCSAFSASGIDAEAAEEAALAALVENGFVLDVAEGRKLKAEIDLAECGSGIWTTTTCSGSGCDGNILDATAFYFDGYSGTTHVVFGLHGLTGDQVWIKNKMCKPPIVGGWSAYTGSSFCPLLEMNEFKHLIFVFPSSGVLYGAVSAWGDDTGDVTTMYEGVEALEELVCNADAFSAGCTSGSQLLPASMGLDSSSEFMIMGYSNGGGCAVYAHTAFTSGTKMYPKVTAALAVAYYGATTTASFSWLPQDGSNFIDLKIYLACADATYYTDDAVSSGSYTFTAYAGITAGTSYGMYYPPVSNNPAPFIEYPFDGVNGGLYYAVHGLDSNGNCNENIINGNVHTKMSNYPDYAGDVLAWTTAPSPPPSPPGTSTTAAAAPVQQPPPSVTASAATTTAFYSRAGTTPLKTKRPVDARYSRYYARMVKYWQRMDSDYL